MIDQAHNLIAAGSPVPKLLSKTVKREQHGPVVIGDVLYARGGSFGPRLQADYQLVVLHSGSLTLTIDSEVVEVPETFGILLSPGHVESFRFARDRETRHSWIALSPDTLAPPLRLALERLRGPVPFLGRMATLLDLARHHSEAKTGLDLLHESAHVALAVAIVCAFASTVLDATHSVPTGQGVLWRLERFIAESYAQPLTLLEMSRAAGASRQHLLKLCRAAARPTPTEQLYAKRLETAADLLLHTGFTIAQIAEQCGFSNQFHFSRKFKQFSGRSPSSWRGHRWRQPVRAAETIRQTRGTMARYHPPLAD